MAPRIQPIQLTIDPRTQFLRIVLKIVGTLFLLVGLALWGREIRFGQTAESASGTIIDVRTIDDPKGATYVPVVEFIPIDGRVVHFQGTWTGPKPDKGTRVTVLYDKFKPEGAKIDSFIQRWLLPVILTPIGFLMLLGAVRMKR